MKKVILFIISLFFIAGCGGGNSIDINNIDQKDILTKNSWYEVCDSNRSYKYDFSNNIYTKTTYSDANFTNIADTKEYIITEYNEAGFYTPNKMCAVSSIIDLDKTYNFNVDYVFIQCVNKDSNNSLNDKLFTAWKNKKLAKDNIDECIK